jgi:hypothetical protein
MSNSLPLVTYDPTITNDFEQALEKVGMTIHDFVLLKSPERITAIETMAAVGMEYESVNDLLNNAPEAIIDEWRFMCGRIAMADSDVAEEVAIRFLYNAWVVDPTTDRLKQILDHVLTEKNQGRYYKMVVGKKGGIRFKHQPPFYMLNGFFNAIYMGKMDMKRVISVFRRDVDWKAGTVRKAAEIYGSAISSIMAKRNKALRDLEGEDKEVVEAEFEIVEAETDEQIKKLGELYDKADRISQKVYRIQKNKILGKETKYSGLVKLPGDWIQLTEKTISVQSGMPTLCMLDGKKIYIGGYKQITLLLPLYEDGTSIPVHGDGYIEQLKALIRQFELARDE